MRYPFFPQHLDKRHHNNLQIQHKRAIFEIEQIVGKFFFCLTYGDGVGDIDITKLVNEKVLVVIQRAESGYYGGPLPESHAHGREGRP